ncbi:hypothetical protein SAMN06296036_109137 [Pseudobacteriovorax antillogorgiicola]|uniref:Uncharacterized protein n=2 Tax=Pseudobacteriovorax antillogorgiicola TaxID=1513793 RepID=A0A1Y6BUZ5_9BACT|nr:hypothetical protein EDD56_10976 [Pseudobacteriovorax antillogorgiicola]SMF29923.1 hypothetical protein SAMN06296036_109137 [Pseudobacteriovorax antillogorgiicola]
MPWKVIGIDADRQFWMKDALEESWQAIRDRYLNQGVPLDEVEGLKLTINQKHHARLFVQGKARDQANTDFFLQPILCRIDDQAYTFLQSGPIRTGLVNYSAQSTFPIQGLLDRDQDVTKNQINNAINKWPELQRSPRKSPLKLKLALKRSSNDSNLGADHCLNVAFSQKLFAQHPIQQFVGTENTSFIKKIMMPQQRLSRANRTIHLDWRKLDDRWQAYGEISESVFGNWIGEAVTWNIKRPLQELVTAEKLIAQLALEAQALDPESSPRVASIYGAWAYLDKGRAWGLKVNDRVYIESGDKRVKGHVVGFFGPRKGLRSTLGYPIHEGAIVFVRTGQKAIRIGDALTFDPTRYPAPWPPVPTPIDRP